MQAGYLTSGASSSASTTTKILYYTNRSATPFMSSVPKQIGDVTLRDFKNLFDRPGFFRFHFKSVDQEFGMVKEEVRIAEDKDFVGVSENRLQGMGKKECRSFFHTSRYCLSVNMCPLVRVTSRSLHIINVLLVFFA